MSERESVGGCASVDPQSGLLLDPSNELRFKGPFDDYVIVSLTIKNPTNKRIAFKIKTTAPKRYCVKPNSGVLDQDQSTKVNILLQPFNYDPSEKNKHKFMVQYLYLVDAEMQLSVDGILNKWKDFPSSRLLDLKLKCVFDFNEAELLKLSTLTPVSESTVIPSVKNEHNYYSNIQILLPSDIFSTANTSNDSANKSHEARWEEEEWKPQHPTNPPADTTGLTENLPKQTQIKHAEQTKNEKRTKITCERCSQNFDEQNKFELHIEPCKEDYRKSTWNYLRTELCVICRQVFMDRPPADLKILPCGHIFHRTCINKRAREQLILISKCPRCDAHFPQENEWHGQIKF